MPTRPPQRVTAKNLTSEISIEVNWSPVPDGHVNGLLVGYSLKFQRIRTAEREVYEAEEHTLIFKPSKLSTVLKVQTYSVYRIKVAAFTQKGLGPYSKYVYAGKTRPSHLHNARRLKREVEQGVMGREKKGREEKSYPLTFSLPVTRCASRTHRLDINQRSRAARVMKTTGDESDE